MEARNALQPNDSEYDNHEKRTSFAARISLQLNTSILTRLAINEESILSQGITGVFGYKFGVRAKVWSNDQVYVSASVAFSRNTLVGITPLQFVRKVIEGGFDRDGDNNLLRIELTSRVSGSLHVAYTGRAARHGPLASTNPAIPLGDR